MVRKNKSIFKDETLNDLVQYCGSQKELMATFKNLQAMLQTMMSSKDMKKHF